MTLMETSGFFVLERIELARMSDKIKTTFEQSEEGLLLDTPPQGITQVIQYGSIISTKL